LRVRFTAILSERVTPVRGGDKDGKRMKEKGDA
jgi:hypothetical protein